MQRLQRPIPLDRERAEVLQRNALHPSKALPTLPTKKAGEQRQQAPPSMIFDQPPPRELQLETPAVRGPSAAPPSFDCCPGRRKHFLRCFESALYQPRCWQCLFCKRSWLESGKELHS